MKLKHLALDCGLELSLLASAHAQAKKPNILVIWGDDIGGFNLDRVMEAVMSNPGKQ